MPEKSSSRPVIQKVIPLTWEVGHAAAAGRQPGRWVSAAVPGAVQLDWSLAEKWPAYWQGDNFKAYGWMEDVWWTYRTRIAPVTVPAGQCLVFACGGIDYDFTVLCNGTVLHAHEGMFTPLELDLTEQAAGGALLEIRLKPAPKAASSRADRTQARLSAKPPVAYEWDWHPRLVPLGIWQETTLGLRPAARLLDAAVSYSLDVASRTAELTLAIAVTAAAAGCGWTWTVHAPDGAVKSQGRGVVTGDNGSATCRMENIELWWPHDQGAQPLYHATFELIDSAGRVLDQRSERLGFRRVKLVMHEGAWNEPGAFPKSRSHPPITLEVNGRAIFSRGSNWVPPEIFPGLITRETYRPLLKLARDANMNLLRSWGGGIVNKASFFELCDEMGLMVWQEFPLACNLYEDDPHYLGVLDAESRSIIRLVKRHPSLAIWSGGNELFNGWSGMTDQSLPLRLLNRNCYDLDQATPFIPTSPIDGVGHGDYRFRDETGREVHQIFATARNTAYTEFGCPGPSSVAYLKRFIPEAELWPPRFGTAWETHHALKAWYPPSATSWLCQEVIEHYFGPSAGLDELVAHGQWLQGEGYKVLFEEARRQKPRSAMALNWCFNEPWPSAANNSLINWPAEPKPAYFAVAAACRSTMASGCIPKFLWHEGELFEGELWLFNDSPEAVPAGRVTAALVIGAQSTIALEWLHPAMPANRHLRGPKVRALLPAGTGADRFTFRLECAGFPGRGSDYTMPLRPVAPPAEMPPAAPMNL